MKNKLAQTLVCSADKFLSNRESTDGLTILAGFPFFEDWGRDTMLHFRESASPQEDLKVQNQFCGSFAFYEKDGLMPNLFQRGE